MFFAVICVAPAGKQVNYQFEKEYIMYSCKSMKGLGLCIECGWDREHRNPVTYTYTKVNVPIREKFFSKAMKY